MSPLRPHTTAARQNLDSPCRRPSFRLPRWLVAASLILALAGAAGAQAQGRPPAPRPQLRATALAQISALAAEKRARTPAQRKMDSHLIFALGRQRRELRMAVISHLRGPVPDRDGTLVVDIKPVSAASVKAIVSRLSALGARVLGVHPRFSSIRARLALPLAETVAAMPEVRFVQPARGPIFEHVDSEGDATHLAAAARAHFGVDGTGVKICVVSNGVDSLLTLQQSGNLPPGVDVLPGQQGTGDEGTAMLEIVHDLAPGAKLGFATANPDEASAAQNILDLANVAKCDVIVDDFVFFSESPFQDTLLAHAVDQVTANGVVYFASAGNEGSLDASTSGTWEGDFKPNGNLDPVLGTGAGTTHDFGDGGQSDPITADTNFGVELHWADPAGASCNDYDLYVLDSTLSNVVEASTNTQSCTQDPIEAVGPAFAGEQVVVVQFSGADRLFNVLAFRGALKLATAGCTRGHNSAALAFGVAAAPAANAAGPGEPSGPYPGPFTAAQQTEIFSCDGPRRVFFDFNGNLLPGAPAGNFSSTGGVVRQKPDITAADGVSTDVPSLAFFYGTSAAAPHAAALAGLVKSAFPGFTSAQVRSALVGTAIDILAPGWDRDSGSGIVMAYPALQQAGAPQRPLLKLGSVTPTEVSPGGDSAIDPGEDWSLSIVLSNIAGIAATGISATLSTTTPGVGITNATSTYPNIAVGGSAANATPFLFTPFNLPCGALIQFTLTVTAAGLPTPIVMPFTLSTGHAGTPVTVSYSGPPVPIPDAVIDPTSGDLTPGTATATLAAAAFSSRIVNLQFSFDGTACTTTTGATTVGVDHPFISDLSFQLVSPQGTSVTLINQTDSDGHNLCQVLLDDSASPSIQTAINSQAPFTGSWQPDSLLAAFKGEDPNGSWKLIGTDNVPQFTGSMRAFSLIVTPAQCPAASTLTANLTAAKAVTGGTLQAGGTVTYTVTLTNSGSGASFDNPGDELTDTLPSTLTLTSATATLGTTTTSGNTVHWNGGVPAGGSVAITINANISASAVVQSVISNQGALSYDPARGGSNTAGSQTQAPVKGGPTEFLVGGAIASVPTLSAAGLAAMALALAAAAALVLGRRRRSQLAWSERPPQAGD